jgi:predicted Zn-dependent protease
LISTPRSPWQRALACLLATLMALPTALPVAAQTVQPTQPVRLPALGESASDDLSVHEERRIGDSIMREARRDPQYLDDPVLLEYLNQLWSPLVAAARPATSTPKPTALLPGRRFWSKTAPSTLLPGPAAMWA